ncbi:ankyrin [Hymenopellis radicata]|nr:ankyrin [Hymenopellis radicata]
MLHSQATMRLCGMHWLRAWMSMGWAGRLLYARLPGNGKWTGLIFVGLLTEARLNTIRLLLSRSEISLFILNAPQNAFRGVTPIGVAAWMNLHNVVELLLKESLYGVSVDGMDTHGATSLMCAARDGNLRVVQLLLHHGARPDFRDRNHPTSIQFSLSHPRVLYLCEEVLRRHRWREAKTASRSKLLPDSAPVFELPPGHELAEPSFPSTINASLSAKLTRSIIRAVTRTCPLYIHCYLPFSYNRILTLLIVFPSLDILNALYYAGADVSLFTTHEHFTPLHCLARSSYIFQDDDRDPLAARDKEDETCIHIAAEHGSCINLLMILLDHDEHGQIRELRNSRAKPEFRVAFGEDAEKLRSASSLSTHTIRPITSFFSLASFLECRPAAHEADVGARLNVLAPINDLSALSKSGSTGRALVPDTKNDMAISGGEILGDEYSTHVVKPPVMGNGVRLAGAPIFSINASVPECAPSLAFGLQFSATPLSRFCGWHEIPGEYDVNTMFHATYFIIERRREALLWSWIEELGGTSEEQEIVLDNLRVTRDVDVESNMRLAGLVPLRSQDPTESATTEYWFVSQNGYPTALNGLALPTALEREECLGFNGQSAWDLFRGIMLTKPECGDAIIAALTRRSDAGLAVFLPRGSTERDPTDPITLPLTLSMEPPPLPRNPRAFAVRLIHRYSFVFGSLPSRFFGIGSLEGAK